MLFSFLKRTPLPLKLMVHFPGDDEDDEDDDEPMVEEVTISSKEAAPAPAPVPAPALIPAPAPPPLPSLKHDWYQTPSHVSLSIMQKNVKEEDLTVDLTAEKVLFSNLYLPIVSNIECGCIIF
jgi:hypothetical protein